MVTYTVYSVTHPNDFSEHRNVYDAHAAASALVELGFDVRCDRYSDCGAYSSMRVLGWDQLCAAVNGDEP
jgi:hypothetical protein